MKKLSLLTIAALAFASLAHAATIAQTTLAIRGMTCGGCVGAVKIQLKRTEGVSKFDVSYEKAEAVVTYDPSKTEPKKIAESVSKTAGEADLRREIQETGGSTASKRVSAHVAAGRCACEIKNPQGSFCLGNLGSTVTALVAEFRGAKVERGCSHPSS